MVIAQVAAGMGGIGKTSLAIEFCHQQRGSVDVVRWLNAENRETLVTEYVRIAPALGLNVEGLEIDDQIARVRSWFEETERSWLVVFDNAERLHAAAGQPKELVALERGGHLFTDRAVADQVLAAVLDWFERTL